MGDKVGDTVVVGAGVVGDRVGDVVGDTVGNEEVGFTEGEVVGEHVIDPHWHSQRPK